MNTGQYKNKELKFKKKIPQNISEFLGQKLLGVLFAQWETTC